MSTRYIYILCKNGKPLSVSCSYIEVMLAIPEITVGQVQKLQSEVRSVSITKEFTIDGPAIKGQDRDKYSITMKSLVLDV